MTKLEYTFQNDILFKLVFSRNKSLLKKLVAVLLGIPYKSITKFTITNPEITPEAMGDKFCRLDINMMVNDQITDLEIQVANEGDYPERSLYYWAREYSTALKEGGEYIDLPRTIVISIIAFKLFKCKEFHSEFMALEVKRHEALTDKFNMIFFELPKVPKTISKDDKLQLWLSLFNADTEERLKEIEETGVTEVEQAIKAYRSVSATNEFKELERLRERARHNEASALGNARRKAFREAEGKWKVVVAEKDAELESLRKQLKDLKSK
ncbi:MAG: Rpn family recombination-promoting nuclease/putative transposase [Lachnospiraceae bacterium]|nr:Rpn family recombination-promoting nuclease/putative transposase [Lachnospiraceae bacterium]